MSNQDYFHERAEESRHNEMIGYVMFIAGSVFFVGGILLPLSMSSSLDWFLFIPYTTRVSQALYLELSFIATGLFLIVAGIATGLHFAQDRSMYMQAILKSMDSEHPLKDARTRNVIVKRSKKN